MLKEKLRQQFDNWLQNLPSLLDNQQYLDRLKDKLLNDDSVQKQQFLAYVRTTYKQGVSKAKELHEQLDELSDQGVSIASNQQNTLDDLAKRNNAIFKLNQTLYDSLTEAERYSFSTVVIDENSFSLTGKLLYSGSELLPEQEVSSSYVLQQESTTQAVELANLDNIRGVTSLNVGQAEDTCKAEEALFIENKRGFLFANSTGTGKTLLALNIVNRQTLIGKNNILIVVSNQNKLKDWQIEAKKFLDLSINKVADTTDKGEGVRITTYANFRDNEALAEQIYDLVVFDESHNLSLGGNSNYTKTLHKHREVTTPRLTDVAIAEVQKLFANATGLDNENLKQYIDSILRHISDSHDAIRQADRGLTYHSYKQRVGEKINDDIYSAIQSRIAKTIFLSATPFAYQKSMAYTANILHGSVDHIALKHLGYRIRYNKVTVPDSAVNEKALQQRLHQTLLETGVMSKRSLDIDADYSRHFALVESPYMQLIDYLRDYDNREAIENNLVIPDIHESFKEFNECLKGSNIYKIFEQEKLLTLHKRIKQHLDVGRKVVVFHQYKKHDPQCPLNSLLPFLKEGELKSRVLGAIQNRETQDIYQLQQRYADKSYLYNGDVTPQKRAKCIKEFNDDQSDCKLLIVQSQAGREGINLHDKTGNYQRVTIDISLPTSPTELVQKEGRIYRMGTKSNAIHEYMVNHAATEKWVFGYNISQRVDFVENLALGLEARNMADIIQQGYLNAIDKSPSLEQGVGGKQEKDAAIVSNKLSDFEGAKLDYDVRQKKTQRNKSQEGIDFYATPEPIGYKCMQWLNIHAGDKVLEPSAGDGAIARYAPQDCDLHAIEPSFSLSSELINKVQGSVSNICFENYDTSNKFDAIAMNPPFGRAGKTAIQHFDKALSHLKDNGRLVIIFPDGSAIDKLRKSLDENSDTKYKKIFPLCEISLPSCTFSKAATQVNTKILVFDKIQNEVVNSKLYSMQHEIKRDLTDCKSNSALFNRIENIELPPRNTLVFTKDKVLINLLEKNKILQQDDKGVITQTSSLNKAKDLYAEKKHEVVTQCEVYLNKNNSFTPSQRNDHVESALLKLKQQLQGNTANPTSAKDRLISASKQKQQTTLQI